ncbi:sortase, partial [Pedococcus sp. 2YAF34]
MPRSRKLLATLLLVVAGTFAAPLAANADQYTSDGGCTISPTTVQAGDSATLTCVPGTFADSESVTYVVSGQNGADTHLASFRTSISTASVVKTSN